MTHRYVHRRVSLLLTLVQANAVARVIDWPQPLEQKRVRAARSMKSPREESYANK